MSILKNSYDTEGNGVSSFFSIKMRHHRDMASRVYKSLPKQGGHTHREHRSKKGRRKKSKPDFALKARQAKREKKAVMQLMRRMVSRGELRRRQEKESG
jgi:hypothetical protein